MSEHFSLVRNDFEFITNNYMFVSVFLPSILLYGLLVKIFRRMLYLCITQPEFHSMIFIIWIYGHVKFQVQFTIHIYVELIETNCTQFVFFIKQTKNLTKVCFSYIKTGKMSENRLTVSL